MQKFGILVPPEMHYSFQSSGLFNKSICKFYTNNMEYINSFHEKKIAVINHAVWFGSVSERHEIIKPFVDTSDFVFILHIEFNREWIDYIKNNRNHKTTFIISGMHNDFENSSDIICNSQFFTFANQFYKFTKPELLQELNPFTVKQCYFDFMPGRPKEHRFFIQDYIKKNNLTSKVISTPIFNSEFIKEILVDYKNKNFWEDQIEKINDDDPNKNWGECLYFGHRVYSCNIIPIKIYNNSAYSIVTETHTENDFSFFTEKIARPMMANRLFVVLSGRHYLKRLKNLGYKTFDNVIDESYDDVDESSIRWQKAAEQIKYLCEQPQEKILEKILPITIHNFKLTIKQNFAKSIVELIEKKVLEIGIY